MMSERLTLTNRHRTVAYYGSSASEHRSRVTETAPTVPSTPSAAQVAAACPGNSCELKTETAMRERREAATRRTQPILSALTASAAPSEIEDWLETWAQVDEYAELARKLFDASSKRYERTRRRLVWLEERRDSLLAEIELYQRDRAVEQERRTRALLFEIRAAHEEAQR